MAVTHDDVRQMATLARLHVPEEDLPQLARELSGILAYMETLNQLDVTDVPPMAHALDQQNVVRPDGVQARITRTEALANAPDADDAYVRVPKVID